MPWFQCTECLGGLKRSNEFNTYFCPRCDKWDCGTPGCSCSSFNMNPERPTMEEPSQIEADLTGMGSPDWHSAILLCSAEDDIGEAPNGLIDYWFSMWVVG